MANKKANIGDGVSIDISTLVDTRLLVQANSGGGKSWLLRKILEQTHGAVQHLIIDPEGEFATLRERYDYVYAARQGGDTSAEPRSAKLLAERLLELGVSAVLDIYELKAHERVQFVRLFLEALVDAPKKLWHPAIVVVDEAHVFCPQQGDAESAGPVIDLATRGRKRGFCAVLATQRLSKLHKDAAAEANNKMIGRTGLDVDVKRAAEELGFGKERWRELRELEPGQFFAFGPAISRVVIPVKVGKVVTSHPKAGARLASVAPPPTARVRALLPKLADLPAEAAARERTVDDLKKDLASARRELVEARKAQPAPKQVEVVSATDRRLVEKALGLFQAIQKDLVGNIRTALDNASEKAARTASGVEQVADRVRTVHEPSLAPTVSQPSPKSTGQLRSNPGFETRPYVKPSRWVGPAVGSAEGISGPEQRILDALAWMASIGNLEPEQPAVAFLAGYTYGAGSFNNPRGSLRMKGLVEYLAGNRLRLTEAGERVANQPDAPPSTKVLHERVLARLPGPEQRLLRPLLEAYPKAMKNEDLARASGYQLGAGSFNNPRGRLRTLGLVDYPAPGHVVALPLLFPDR
jgi:uncharacterized protein